MGIRLSSPDIIGYSINNWIPQTVVFLAAVSLLYFVDPLFGLVVGAAALVRPMRFLLSIGGQDPFDESDWQRTSPIGSNLENPRFLGAALLLASVPFVHWSLETGIGWDRFGSFAFLVSAVSIAVFVWSESTYTKNFYFDRWHILERAALVVTGTCSIVTPVFVPLFLFVHRILIGQFDHPKEVASFNSTHSALPYSILLVDSAFVFVGLFAEIGSDVVGFLLLAGFAAQYFLPGLVKLSIGPAYYLRYNNPVYMGLNGYLCGWMSFLDEDTVLKIGAISERIKPALSLGVIAIEIGVISVLVSRYVAIAFGFATFLLHALIFVSSGDDFWKWMLVDLSVAGGLILLADPGIPFGDPLWIAAFVPFVFFGLLWLDPRKLGWLDSPYAEVFRFEGELENGETVELNPNMFRPYDFLTTQGTTGTFDYLGDNPRITYSHGDNIQEYGSVALHEQIRDAIQRPPLDQEAASYLVEECGTPTYDPEKTERLGEFLAEFLESHEDGVLNRLLRYISSPREFYSGGFSRPIEYDEIESLHRVEVHRIDGIWTAEGFQELSHQTVLRIDL